MALAEVLAASVSGGRSSFLRRPVLAAFLIKGVYLFYS